MARAFYQESLALLGGMGHKRGITECLEALAKIACAQGQTKWTARVYGATEALREDIGIPLLPPDRPIYDRAIVALRAALDGEAFAIAWAAGRMMTLEQAIGYALEEPVSNAM